MSTGLALRRNSGDGKQVQWCPNSSLAWGACAQRHSPPLALPPLLSPSLTSLQAPEFTMAQGQGQTLHADLLCKGDLPLDDGSAFFAESPPLPKPIGPVRDGGQERGWARRTGGLGVPPSSVPCVLEPHPSSPSSLCPRGLQGCEGSRPRLL